MSHEAHGIMMNTTYFYCMEQYCSTPTSNLLGTVFAPIMLIIFIIVLAVILAVIIRTCQRRVVLFKTEILFYIFLLLYLIGRGLWFLILTSLRGQKEKNITSNSTAGYISNISYHTGSTFFYSAFSILVINWAENLLHANGMSIELAKKKTFDIKLIASILNIIMFILEIFILTGYSIAVALDAIKFYNGLAITQLGFHAFCALIIVLFFLIWTVVSGRRVIKVRFCGMHKTLL
jgi:hypothetical protein